jgi:hypothetical protein
MIYLICGIFTLNKHWVFFNQYQYYTCSIFTKKIQSIIYQWFIFLSHFNFMVIKYHIWLFITIKKNLTIRKVSKVLYGFKMNCSANSYCTPTRANNNEL